eukprot:PITA_27576
MERFGQRDPEQHFVELTRLKTGSPKTYIADFLRVSMMVPNLSTARRVYMYVEGLAEPLRGLVRSTRPATLQDAINRTRDLQDVLPRTRTPYPQRQTFQSKGRDVRIRPPKGNPGQVQLDDDARRELKKKRLCFTCQEPWAPGHRCAAGKAHVIEVFSESSGEEDDEDDVEAGDSHAVQGPLPPPPPAAGSASFAPTEGALAALRGIPKYLTLRVRGTVCGQRVSVLVDSGATHNFIDAQMVERRELSVTMGTYKLTDHFFVVDIPNTNMILGVQWLSTLGKVTTDWKTLEMEWDDEKTGRHEKIRGQHTYPPQTVSAHRMEAVLQKGHIECAVELRASEAGTTGQTVHPEILDRYAIVFGEIPPGQPPDRGFEHTTSLSKAYRP